MVKRPLCLSVMIIRPFRITLGPGKRRTPLVIESFSGGCKIGPILFYFLFLEKIIFTCSYTNCADKPESGLQD